MSAVSTPKTRTTSSQRARLKAATCGGFGIRVDSHIYQGYRIPPYYDSLIGKICVHGKTREQAMAKMRVALAELAVTGIKTNTPLHRDLFADAGFQKAASASTIWNTGWKIAKPNRTSKPPPICRLKPPVRVQTAFPLPAPSETDFDIVD